MMQETDYPKAHRIEAASGTREYRQALQADHWSPPTIPETWPAEADFKAIGAKQPLPEIPKLPRIAIKRSSVVF